MNRLYISHNEVKSSQLKILLPIVFMFLSVLFVFSFTFPNRTTAIFYVSIIIFSVGLIYISQINSSKTNKNLFVLLSFLLLAFILGFRDLSGIDDPIYLQIFNLANGRSLVEYINSTDEELGFKVLNYIIYRITNGNYYICQIVFAVIPIAIFYRTFQKYSDFISFPLAIFILVTTVYFQILSVALVRIFIAMAIFLYSIENIWLKKPFKFMLIILTASLFHISALFWLILIPFAINFNINNKKKYLIVYYSIILIFIPIALFIVSKYLVPILGVKYSAYIFGNGEKINLLSFDIVPIIILGLFLERYIPNKYKQQYKVFLIILTFSPIVTIYSSLINFGRLSLYSNLARIVIFSMTYRFIPKEKPTLKYGFGSFVLCYCFLYMYRTQMTIFMENLFPYYNKFFII
ncbi:MAG: EpsG family protein [Oscillospiraceae bacterium]